MYYFFFKQLKKKSFSAYSKSSEVSRAGTVKILPANSSKSIKTLGNVKFLAPNNPPFQWQVRIASCCHHLLITPSPFFAANRSSRDASLLSQIMSTTRVSLHPSAWSITPKIRLMKKMAVAFFRKALRMWPPATAAFSHRLLIFLARFLSARPLGNGHVTFWRDQANSNETVCDQTLRWVPPACQRSIKLVTAIFFLFNSLLLFSERLPFAFFCGVVGAKLNYS